jgi:hypothetical protein
VANVATLIFKKKTIDKEIIIDLRNWLFSYWQESFVAFQIVPIELCAGRTQGSLLQKQVIFTKKFSQGPHLERCKKHHPVNLDKLIWTCPM